jgi:ABC-type multidrug transport system ATPase subunit/ABC-type multidrug transport system permease subunit
VSGAGKSTLLDVLAGRKTAGSQEGIIYVNDAVIDRNTFARIAGYVEQSDLHMPNTTVEEALLFAATLRLPASLHEKRKLQIVKGVMHLVELVSLAGRLVGVHGEKNALSPSQRKLLTIAVELVAQPSILFLDEPTSGLDSRAAANVMRVVRNIARNGRTVICTIHQPSKEVFLSSFDAMLLLQKGGHEVFCGPLGKDANYLLEYLQAFPGVQAPNATTNPATFMLSVLDNKSGHLGGNDAPVQDTLDKSAPVGGSAESPPLTASHASSASTGDVEAPTSMAVRTESGNSGSESLQPSTDFAATYQGSAMAQCIRCELDKVKSVQPATQSTEDRMVTVSLWTQLACVFHRHAISNWRNHNLNSTRFVVTAVLAVVFGLSYLNVPQDTSAGLVSLVNFTTISTSFIALMNTTVIIPALISERAAFYRERSSDMYPSWVYSISVIIVELPCSAILSLLFAALSYWPAGLQADAGTFWLYSLVVFAQTVAFTAVGMAFAALMPDSESAQQLASLFTTIFLLVNGTFQPFPTTPAGWAWFRYVNPAAYSLNALASPQLFCQVERNPACPLVSVATAQGSMQVPSWTFASELYDLNYDERFRDVGLIFVNAAAWFITYTVALKYVSHIKR